jgi:pimeloyl-ACP methyl ester carboxylesterase
MPHASIARVNGLDLAFEGTGVGEPLILLHGGLGSRRMFAPILPTLAAERRVILVDLQAHGGTADIDRPIRPTLLADDVAALIEHLGLPSADVLGYSLGGEAALRLAIQHPHLVRRLVLVSVPFRRDGWFPEVRASMDAMSAAAAEPMRQSPLYADYAALAPRPQDWPALVGKTADSVQQDFDWTEEVAALTTPTLLVFADADSIAPAHIAEFYAHLGGGLHDADWDGSNRPVSRLAVLPGSTHYDIVASPLLPAVALPFLNAND